VPCRCSCKLPTASLLRGSGEIRSQGIDFELQGALTENWQVGGGYTYARVHTLKDAANPQNVNQRFDTDTPRAHVQAVTPLPFSRAHWKNCGSVATSPGKAACTTMLLLADGSKYRLKQGAYAITDLMAGYKVNQHLDLQLNANMSSTASTMRPSPAP